MGVPGWGTVAGVAAKFIDRLSDPVRKKEALQDERKRIVKQPSTPDRAQRLADLDTRIFRLQIEIDRRAN